MIGDSKLAMTSKRELNVHTEMSIMAEYISQNESKNSGYTSSSSSDESEYDTYESDSSSNEDGRGEIQPYASSSSECKWR